MTHNPNHSIKKLYIYYAMKAGTMPEDALRGYYQIFAKSRPTLPTDYIDAIGAIVNKRIRALGYMAAKGAAPERLKAVADEAQILQNLETCISLTAKYYIGRV
jgi:hypothetical protein